MGFTEFANSIKKVNEGRIHKVNKSYGIYDGFKYYRKHKPVKPEYVLSESQYFAITRRVNDLMAGSLHTGEDIIFPERMGRLELRKYKSVITIDNGKVKTNLPIDWDRTLKLWYEDEEACKNKTLIKVEEKEIFKVYYNRIVAKFINKSFYGFNVNRDLKRSLKQSIKEGLDAFTI